MKVFKNREELKWHFHKLLCKGDCHAEYLMNAVYDEALETVEDLNEWLQKYGYKVKEL